MEPLIIANLPTILAASVSSFLILYTIHYIKSMHNEFKKRKEIERLAAKRALDDLIKDFKRQKEEQDND